MRHREPAICIRSIDYSETSQVLGFFARDTGVVTLLAKGSKRAKSKSGGAIDLLCEGEVVFLLPPSGAMGTLVEFTETAPHLDLRADANRLNAALYMIELAGSLLAESDPHPGAFDLLHNALARLGAADAPVAAVLAYFQWRMLRHVGLLGQLRACMACGRAVAPGGREAYFSSLRGGLLCRACEGAEAEKYRLDADALAGLALLAAAAAGGGRTQTGAGGRAALPEPQASAVNRLLAYHAAHQLGKPLKMARHAIG